MSDTFKQSTEFLLTVAQKTEKEMLQFRDEMLRKKAYLEGVLRAIAENSGVREKQQYRVTQQWVDGQPTDGYKKHWADYLGVVYHVSELRLHEGKCEALIFAPTRNNALARVPVELIPLMELLPDEYGDE